MNRVKSKFVSLTYRPYVWTSGPMVLEHDTLDDARDYAIKKGNNHPGYEDHVEVWYGEIQREVPT